MKTGKKVFSKWTQIRPNAIITWLANDFINARRGITISSFIWIATFSSIEYDTTNKRTKRSQAWRWNFYKHKEL